MKIITGVASTTHVDSHGDKITREALDGMAEQICATYIPQLVEHDPKRQIGVVLYGEVIELEDEAAALMVVCGHFESDAEFEEFPNGARNTVWRQYALYLEGAREDVIRRIADSPREVETPAASDDEPNTAELLERHLDSTSVWTDGRVYRVKHLVASTGDLKIEIYPKDHAPPHFHVTSKQRGINASFRLDTLELIKTSEGEIRTKDIKKIQHFLQTNPEIWQDLKDTHRRMQ